ncbi:hypothetical protein HDU81_011137 [Chytriomyces hyalinus]|nr:hypothetical protein HDU81_011137 [Chytriomyces hyalinus]
MHHRKTIPFLLTALAAFTAANAAVCYNQLSATEFPNCAALSPTVALHWALNASHITFGVDADVPSNSMYWFAIGISEMGGMFGADIWMLTRVPGNQSYVMMDLFSKTTVRPVPDSEQDVVLLTPPPPSNTNTLFTFTRPLETCDSSDYPITQGRSFHMIWAHGQGDPAGGPIPHRPSDSDRGNAELVLYPDSNASVEPKENVAIRELEESNNLLTFDARFPANNVIPLRETSYMCSNFQLPVSSKNHVVQYEGIVDSSHLHHMIVFGCASKPVQLGQVVDCSSMQLDCSQIMFMWAPGKGKTVLPIEAGYAIGPDEDSFQYITLQLHYTNQQRSSNIPDSSGFRIYYTSKLRPNDVGTLTLGSRDILIPGNTNNYTNLKQNICPSECTSKFPHDLVVISNGFHMHTLGYNASSRQIRQGQEISPLGVRQYYNFGFQGNTLPTDAQAVIKPGDAIITQCTYLPTTGLRSLPTTLGERTEDEMCYNFVTYYPALKSIDTCISGKQNVAFCSLKENAGLGLTVQAVQKGYLIPFAPPSFVPYAPVCTPSAQVVVAPSLSHAVVGSLCQTFLVFTAMFIVA